MIANTIFFGFMFVVYMLFNAVFFHVMADYIRGMQ